MTCHTQSALRIALMAALAVPFASLAQQQPQQPPFGAPVDPVTPAQMATPVDATDPEQGQTWAPAEQIPATPAAQPATPTRSQPAAAHVVVDQQGQQVRIQSHLPASVVGQYQLDFDALDTNGDGAISRSEARANPNLSAEFNAVDTNRDGRLSREELAGWAR